jgi:transcriptional regulator with XRE-family HTH domain
MLFRHALGEVIKARRTEQRLTLRQVSGTARVALGYLSEVERGHKEISSELLDGIANGLGVETGELILQTGLKMNGVEIPDTAETLLDEYSDLVAR